MPLVKLKAMLRYFCDNTDPSLLGKTKLMKLFYFADFTYVKRYGVPITYDRYVNLEHGPVPSKILNLINSVVDEGDDAILSDTISIKEVAPNFIQQIECIKKFNENDRKLFSKKELETLEYVCKKFSDKSAKQLEDLSHKEAPWYKTRELEEIPYEFAAYDDDCLVEEEDIKLLTSIE